MDKHYITENSFEKIFVYLKGRTRGKCGTYCKNPEKTRVFLEAVYFIMRTGAQWIELPRYYGEYKSIHKRYIAWAKKRVWNDIHAHFAQDYDGDFYD